MPKVSVIVPVYNVEKYLARCVESIQAQTEKDIQIILVNDGSTDNSLEICKKYQAVDGRIEVIDKPNEGVSSARNKGIEIARGEYIGFIDPDDWIEKDMYENMYNAAKSCNADVCMCDYVLEVNSEVTPVKLATNDRLLNRDQILNFLIPNMIASKDLNSKGHEETIMGSVCRLLIKKEIIDRYNLRFELGVPLAEDLIFCIELLINCDLVCYEENAYYHYILKSNTAVTSYRKDMYKLQERVQLKLEEILREAKLYEYYKQRLDVRYINYVVFNGISNETRPENKKDFREKIQFVKNICKNSKLKSILKEVDTEGYTLRKKIVLSSLKYERALFLYMYYMLLNKIK